MAESTGPRPKRSESAPSITVKTMLEPPSRVMQAAGNNALALWLLRQTAGGAMTTDNPKKAAREGDAAPSNIEKDPDDWVTGDEPMTGAQASYLNTLSEEAHEDFDANLTKAE